ncbi:S1/P1 nuclease [Paraflavitalea pollutisoli]|uniref:S1/P1 nuclease n=1 Tax=Paraflavitalea pollutisoli TaxID=3034143 RepID=UPI0023EB5AF3|nr:S1/P1 nuclease [Paraflavitalea sp. H1-2-19X]
MLFYIPAHSMAWGMLGHRITGEIADHYLTKKARRQIAAILGNESLAMSANWPDFIKSDPAYNYLSPWHYVNFKEGLSEQQVYDYLAKDTATDIYTKLNFVIGELKNKSLEQDKKLLYLRILIHLVGDAHQPMHTGRPDDLGGNRISVSWFNQTTNLHSVWDEKLISYQELSYTEYTKAINFTTKTQRQEWQAQPIRQWLFESYTISNSLYAEIKEPNQKLSYRYNFDHVDTLNDRLLKGGVRLAGVLNEIFG